jgi:hypothetical protein
MLHKAGFAKVLGFSLLAIVLIASGSACKKAAETAAPVEGAAPIGGGANGIIEGLNEVSGNVKAALGNYFYLPQVPGFDIAVMGPVENGDATTLVGKDVKVKAIFHREKPNLLVAQSIEIKESETQFRGVYTSTDAAAPADFFDQKIRAEYADVKLTNINKSEEWEGKGKGKVFGLLLPGAEGKGGLISVLDAAGKEVAKVVVDSQSSYSDYYVKKLRLFDKYWFYLNIKESVDKKLRAKNKEIFHADMVFVGLY